MAVRLKYSPAFLLFAVMALAVCACATDDMSTMEHRAEAKYKVNGVATSTANEYWPQLVYNPAGSHDRMGKEYEEHVQRHIEAAKLLADFEEATCIKFPKSVRVVCPLRGQVSRVEDIDKGARIHLIKSHPIQAILDHMLCHQAFGLSVGHKGMPECPLYLKGIQIRLSSGGNAVEITSDEPQVASEIVRRARLHVQTTGKP
jgi:hypothetical protein